MLKEQDQDDEELRKKIATPEKPVVVNFTDPCGQRKMVDQTIENLADEYEGSIERVKISVDENQSKGQEYSILDIPILSILMRGKILSKIVDAHTPSSYRDKADLGLRWD